MIDLKALRDDPDRYRHGIRAKGADVDLDRVLNLDSRRRALQTKVQELRAEQAQSSKKIGPEIGRLNAALSKADDSQRAALQAEIDDLKAGPARLKAEIERVESEMASIDPELDELVLAIPQPPAQDVPEGASDADNVELRRWSPEGFDPASSFREQRGFDPAPHTELASSLGLVDFERGVKLGGTRHYVLTGLGARLHRSILRYAHDAMADRFGFTPVTVPVIVREEMMVGTGFFPGGRDQAYHIEETRRGSGHDLFLTGTGEVSLMGMHQGEILNEQDLPLRYVTVSTCFRREAGAAGKDTSGLYRIHQFEKVEQVVICRAGDEIAREWHQRMIGYVETLLQELGLAYRLVECCTGDLGLKNEAMVDIECWMPGRGETDPRGVPTGAYGETHSASRLGDFQCRRLNMRYRPGGQAGRGPTTFCCSLNNTVAASPRLLIPIIEMHQQPDGSVVVPKPLRPHMGGIERLEPVG